MKIRTVNRDWLVAAIKASVKTQRALAKGLGLDDSRMTEILKGTRRVRISEAETMARLLQKPQAEVMEALGELQPEPVFQKLNGYVGASEEVIIFDYASEDYSLDEVEMRIGSFAGLLLQIRGDSMSPRYFDGEIIGIHSDEDLDVAPEKLLGQEVVARCMDGRVLLKVLQAGRTPGTYSLISLNPRVPPLIDLEIVWAREIELRLPARAKRTIFRSS